MQQSLYALHLSKVQQKQNSISMKRIFDQQDIARFLRKTVRRRTGKPRNPVALEASASKITEVPGQRKEVVRIIQKKGNFMNRSWNKSILRRRQDDEELQELIRTVLDEAADEEYISLSDKIRIGRELFNSFRKLDVLQELLEDDSVPENIVNGIDHIFFMRKKEEFSGLRNAFCLRRDLWM